MSFLVYTYNKLLNYKSKNESGDQLVCNRKNKNH